jgi:N-methylhydantoinase B
VSAVEYDPVTLKIAWDRMVAICHDAAATMVRTTFSPVVREGNDYCCSLIDARGRQLAEPLHTLPSFTGTLPFTVRHMLDRFPLRGLRPGDSLLTNDPWFGTGQLNDFNVATPVFDQRGAVIAIASSTAHMTDVGGSSSVFGSARDVHEEGLRVPISRIAQAGVLNDDLIDIIRANVRMPDECIGDLAGMLASNRTMSTRLLELLDDMAITDFGNLSDEILHRSEDAMRASIAEIKPGHYEGSVTFDGPGFDVTIQATVDVGGGEIAVDFSGSSPQRAYSSINVAMNYTYSFSVYPLKLLVNPRLPSNDGCLRCFRISAPQGSILNSQWPAAGYHRNFVGHMIHAALFSALKEAVPERVWAHSGSAPAGLECLSGFRNDGELYVHLFFAACGGTGAMPNKDGELCFFPTNARGTSVELTESKVPVLFESKQIVPDSAGPGRFRGGSGGSWTIRNIGSGPVVYSGQIGRMNYPALGLHGGGAGQLNSLYLNGEKQERNWGSWSLNPGDKFTKQSSGGGGLGSPQQRDPALVLEDVLDGYVSVERARRDYSAIVNDGVVTRLAVDHPV